MLSLFTECTKEYKEETNTAVKQDIKKKAFEKWTTYLFMRNSDQRKYGTLMKKFRTDYSLGENLYPANMMVAGDVLLNHPWDVAYKESEKHKKQQQQENKQKKDQDRVDQQDRDKEKSGITFKQRDTGI